MTAPIPANQRGDSVPLLPWTTDSACTQGMQTYYISSHTMFTGRFFVYHMSPLLETYAFPGAITDAYRNVVTELADQMTPSPLYTLTKQDWSGSHYIVTDQAEAQVAEWQHPFSSFGTASLTFPPDSAHSSHPITSAPTSPWTFSWSERFVSNSATYVWEMTARWRLDRFALKKITGDQETIVGHFARKSEFTVGGTLVLNLGEIDELVGILTCLVRLAKFRQRRRRS